MLKAALLSVGIAIASSWLLPAAAQSSPPSEIPPEAPEVIEQTIPRLEPSVPLPELPAPLPEPSLQTPAPPPAEDALPEGTALPITSVEIVGFTVLQDEIAAALGEFEGVEAVVPFCDSVSDSMSADDSVIEGSDNQQSCGLRATVDPQRMTFATLVELRSAVTQLYIDNGYITSGAFLPNNQDLSDGDAQIQVVEGQLERIDVGGLNRLNDSYVRDRVELATDQPLNRDRLEEALQLLQLDPLLEQVNAELTAGTIPGQNVLRLNVQEAPSLQASVLTDNSQSSSIGSEQLSVSASYANLLGRGDRLTGGYGVTEGLDAYDVSYALPLNARDGTLTLRYGQDDSGIIEDELRDLDIDIRSESETISLGFRQPVVRSPEAEIALGLTFDLRRSQTFLNDEPFSFAVGPEEGESRVAVLRFSQEWVDRNATSVLAARSQFSLGIDAFDATINETGPDGQFLSWQGQFQWVQQLTPSRIVLVSQIGAQLTPDSLLSLERFSVGGVSTVRGYAQNQLVADNGIFGSVEARIPLTADANRLQLAPFFDIGSAWNNGDNPDPDPGAIASLGLGLRWQVTPDLAARLDYGIPLTEVEDRGNSLQENGIHFSIRYQPF
ncbi:MAG: ShlB/FhaC/HecB family hemolysin secretion/activation protein [Leptolyngbyaceae cyanobacterium SM1_4_3]|nr:ShlB/FhaC/HecB family hemolysin secretion/activation protein [Leptolyngbyaceae cyanobacterium SM1_4_3]